MKPNIQNHPTPALWINLFDKDMSSILGYGSVAIGFGSHQTLNFSPALTQPPTVVLLTYASVSGAIVIPVSLDISTNPPTATQFTVTLGAGSVPGDIVQYLALK